MLCIKECGKIVGNYSEQDVNEVSDSIPKKFGKVAPLKEAYEESEKFKNWVDENQDIFAVARKLEGLNKNTGVHPSGIAISFYPLDEICPLQQTNDGDLVSGYDMNWVAELMVKFDILGLRTLSVIYDVCKQLDFDLNSIITDYNNIITKRNRYITEAGPNNVLAKSLESQLDNIVKNISNSIQNYLSSLDIKIDNLKNKELEFQNLYSNVPENEKTLRSIERELSIKEALYLLLLQKREEAAINLAVVKPTIKIIDYPITNPVPIFPRPNVVYLSALVTAVLLYFGLLYFWFLLDDKIHNKEHLLRLLNPDIPVIAEIPFIPNAKEIDIIDNKFSRSPLVESVRMLLSNLRFLNSESKDKGKCTSLLFTSSIKGEGKTLASVNAAAILAADNNKVLLIGADLRNPQIHKLFEIEKDRIGLSELLYKNDNDNFQKYLNKFENLDVLFSGAIPPNPTSLLGSKAFKNLLKSLKEHYDYILIDSAPCLLVSDTFQLVNYVDFIIYLFRANYTQNKITNYINELYSKNDVKSLSVVFNAVGNSKAYGYKYGYQYGYQYGYKYGYNYGYNYGYGYGYGSDEESKTD